MSSSQEAVAAARRADATQGLIGPRGAVPSLPSRAEGSGPVVQVGPIRLGDWPASLRQAVPRPGPAGTALRAAGLPVEAEAGAAGLPVEAEAVREAR